MAEKDRMRTKEFLLYLSDEELQNLKQEADMEHLSVNEFLRKLIVHGLVVHTVDKEMIINMASEFSRIGNEINAIAKKVNTLKTVTDEDVKNLKVWISELECLVYRNIYAEEN